MEPLEAHRSSAKLYLFVEGPTDKSVVSEILRKLGTTAKFSWLRNPEKAAREVLSLRQRFDKFIFLFDLRGNQKNIKHRFERVLAGLPAGMHRQIERIIVRHEIEAWLLADSGAVKRVSGHEVSILDPEAVIKAAERLDEIFKRCGKRYIKGSKQAAELAKAMELDKAVTKSPSLREFIVKCQSEDW